MRTTRQGKIDEDIIFDNIKSKIIRSLIGKLDSYYEDGVYYFVDIQKRFFCNFLDFAAYYEVVESYDEMLNRLEKNILLRQQPFLPFYAPIMQVFYCCPRNRGNNIQRSFLDYIFSVAEEEQEPLASFCDPFSINGESFADGADSSFMKFLYNGIKPTEKWLTDSVKQRQRFLKAGFRNIKYNAGEVTEHWQQFLYLPDSCSEEYKRTANKLEVHYNINEEKLEELE